MDNSGVNNLIERFGISSILTTFGIKSAEAAEMVELSESWIISTWGMPEWALMVSMISGIVFIINGIQNFYLKCKKRNNKKGE